MNASFHYPVTPVKTREVLANEYQIDVRTLRRWLRRENIDPPPGPLTPKWQTFIYAAFGHPPLKR